MNNTGLYCSFFCIYVLYNLKYCTEFSTIYYQSDKKLLKNRHICLEFSKYSNKNENCH